MIQAPTPWTSSASARPPELHSQARPELSSPHPPTSGLTKGRSRRTDTARSVTRPFPGPANTHQRGLHAGSPGKEVSALAGRGLGSKKKILRHSASSLPEQQPVGPASLRARLPENVMTNAQPRHRSWQRPRPTGFARSRGRARHRPPHPK
ncbi:hypothetical protein chiPu_0024053 [Chiloscyllium punctatum]|uniref:Uncharacterized protein n=1 Tax=Chiloscyllium punctatum TaxID=137246 RepID=A0A401TCE3_CHIPU|nr:hypothetical protein [Chiloscyllium punctatum]